MQNMQPHAWLAEPHSTAYTSSVSLVSLSHGGPPAALDPARHPAIISIYVVKPRGLMGVCHWALMLGGYAPSDLEYPQKARSISHDLSQLQNACLLSLDEGVSR